MYEYEFEGGMLCEPKAIYRFTNEDGQDDGEMNCHYCDKKECEYWSDYNDTRNE